MHRRACRWIELAPLHRQVHRHDRRDAHIVMAYIGMACTAMAYIVMAFIGMPGMMAEPPPPRGVVEPRPDMVCGLRGESRPDT